MAEFLRPEARAALARWSGVLAGLAVAGLGLWWAASGGPVLTAVGAAVGVIGLLLAGSGLVRARYSPGGESPGHVEIDERRLSFFHPRGGLSVSLEQVSAIDVEARGGGAGIDWVFHHLDDPGTPLIIPSGASGAERLLDALAAFPGADYAKVIAAAQSDRPLRHTVWRRPARPGPRIAT